MEYILKTHNLTKRYNNTTAVNNININIKKGDIYGFLGQNGAGKTTDNKPNKTNIRIYRTIRKKSNF